MLIPLSRGTVQVPTVTPPPPKINHPTDDPNVLDPPSPLPTQQTLDPNVSNPSVSNASLSSPGVEESPTTEYESNGAANGADPYSNLDGAFGNYIADEPRPMQNVRQSGIDDDLLV